MLSSPIRILRSKWRPSPVFYIELLGLYFNIGLSLVGLYRLTVYLDNYLGSQNLKLLVFGTARGGSAGAFPCSFLV